MPELNKVREKRHDEAARGLAQGQTGGTAGGGGDPECKGFMQWLRYRVIFITKLVSPAA